MNKYAIAGKQLIKGNIGNAIQAIATKNVSSELIVPSRWRNGSFFYGINGADKAFIWGNFNSSLLAYQHCPVVSSIINRQASCLINGKRSINDANGKEATSTQALAIKKLLNNPNPIQSGLQFRAQGKVYKSIYGYCPILVIKPVGFENDYSKWRLWNIPPWMIRILDKLSIFYEVDPANPSPFRSILLTYMGHSIELDPNCVFFLRENQISTGTYMYNSNQANVSLYLPDSKLFSLEKPIDNLIGSLNSRGALIRNRGPLWLLTNDSTDNAEAGIFPNDPDQISDLHKDFMKYGLMEGQRKAIITDAKLKLQTVGFDVAQLKLLEGEVHDAKHICDALNFPPYLMGLIDSKYDNQDIAERSLYTNCIIPDANSEDEQLGVLLGLDLLGLSIKTDYSHLPALQENEEKKGRGRLYMDQALIIEFKMNLITLNQWMAMLVWTQLQGVINIIMS